MGKLTVYPIQQNEETIKSLKEQIVYLKNLLDKILLSDKKGNKDFNNSM